MKKLGLISLYLALLVLIACNRNGNNNDLAAVPQACGNGIPQQYCMPYMQGMGNPYLGMSGYGPGAVGPYGYGINQPYYGAGVPYGCPYGYQPMYTGNVWNGSGFTCIAANYLTYQQPFYPNNFTWGNSGYVGMGPIQACDVYNDVYCRSYGSYCRPAFGNYGYCAR